MKKLKQEYDELSSQLEKLRSKYPKEYEETMKEMDTDINAPWIKSHIEFGNMKGNISSLDISFIKYRIAKLEDKINVR